MTDRHAGYVVTLAEDIREDDAETVISALSMVRGVVRVEPVVVDPELHIAQARVAVELRDKLYELASTL